MGEIVLSEYGRASSVPSPVNRMMADFASDFRDGVDINLGVGYVNEDTIPAEKILHAMDEVICHPQEHRLSLNYGGPAGSANLVAAVRRFLIDGGVGGLTGQVLSDRRIIIGPNGASSLLESIAYVLPRGVVVTTDPMYYIYTDFLRRRGFELLTVPEDGEGIRTDLLAAKLAVLGDRAEQVRFLYVVTVNNPSCVILSNRRRREVVAAASGLSQRLGRAVPVVFDRAYEDLVHDPAVEPIESGLCFDADGIVYEIGTLSKVLAPALRIGYMIGRDGPFLAACVQRTSDAGFSAPMITQEIAARLLDGHMAAQLRLSYGFEDTEAIRRAVALMGDAVRYARGQATPTPGRSRCVHRGRSVNGYARQAGVLAGGRSPIPLHRDWSLGLSAGLFASAASAAVDVPGGWMPYRFSLFSSVARVMPSSAAARVRCQPASSSARMMKIRSAVSREKSSDCTATVSSAAGASSDAPAWSMPSIRMSAGVISSARATMTARSITWLSSRTLPGQSCRWRSCRASGDRVFRGLPGQMSVVTRKYSASRAMSPRRAGSRRGGIVMGKTARRK